MSKKGKELAGALIALVQPWGGTGIEDQRERFIDLIDAELRRTKEACLKRALLCPHVEGEQLYQELEAAILAEEED